MRLHKACLQHKSDALNNLSCRKEMVLLNVTDTARSVMFGPMESRGSLVYKFASADVNIPIMMQNLEDPVSKVIYFVKDVVYV